MNIERKKNTTPYLVAMAVLSATVGFAAAPSGVDVSWDETTKAVTFTLPAGDYTVDSDLWLADGMSGVAKLNFLGSGATVRFSGSTYSTGLAKLDESGATVFIGSGVTVVPDMESAVGKGFFTRRSDVGFDLAPGAELLFEASAGAAQQLYTGAAGLTLTGATVRDRRLGAYSTDMLSDRTEGLGNLLHVDGTIFVKASETPSVISSPCLMISAGTVFDVKTGATLKLDAPAQDEWVAAGTPRRFGGFCKLGGGELVLSSDCELTGRIVVKDGVLRLGAGVRASAVDWEVYKGAKVVLSDGSLLTGSGVKTVPAVMRRAQIHLDASVFNGGNASAAKDHLFTIRNIGSAGGVFTQFNNSRMNFVLNGFADGKPAFLFNEQPYVLEGFKNTSRDVTVFMVRRNFQQYRSPFNFVNMSYLREHPELTRRTAGFYDSASFGVSHGSTSANSVNLWSANKGSSGNNELANRGFTSTASAQTDPLIEMFAQWGRKNEDTSDLVVRQFAAAADNLVTTGAQTINTSAYPDNALNHDYLAIGMRVFDASNSYKLEVGSGVNDGNYGDQNFNLAEFIAFFERPTEAELTEITDYLRAKWFDAGIEAVAPLKVEVGGGATASVDEAPAHAVEKTGDGTLRVSSVGAAAQDSLSVQEGTLAFGSATLAAKASVWLDPVDDSVLTKNANNSVKAIKNKGTLGGDFKVNNTSGWSDAYMGNAYTLSTQMLQFGGSTSFDLAKPLFEEASEDPVTVFLVMAVNRDCAAWRRILSLMSPTNEVHGTSNTPPEIMDLMLSSAGNVTGGKPFAYQVKTDGVSGFAVDRSVYSATSWTESDYGKPVLVAIEDYPTHLNCMLANATDGGNMNGSDNTRHSHRYGLLRLGATAAAGGGASACFKGGIGELIVFNKALTAAEKTAVRDYLAARWFSSNETATAPAVVAGGSQSGRVAKADLALADGVTVRSSEEGVVSVGALELADNASATLVMTNLPTDDNGMKFFQYDTFSANGGQFVLEEHLAAKWKIHTTAPYISIDKYKGLVLIIK